MASKDMKKNKFERGSPFSPYRAKNFDAFLLWSQDITNSSITKLIMFYPSCTKMYETCFIEMMKLFDLKRNN